MKTRIHRSLSSWAWSLWQDPDGPCLLNPIHATLWTMSGLYRLGLALDQRRKRGRQHKLPAFVVSVGNIEVGGTGKTPFTLWLAETLQKAGARVAVLSRGYGRRAEAVARLPQGTMDSQVWEGAAGKYGDEPVLLARRLPSVPVWVGRSRFIAGQKAMERDGPSVLILDDGFQHLGLHRDLDLVLLDAGQPFGNGHLLPLGSLREPIDHLSRASALVLTRATDEPAAARTRSFLAERFPGKPVFGCRHRLTMLASGVGHSPVPRGSLQGRRAVAFAGLARPEPFFESLGRLISGFAVVEAHAFPDHHAYTREDGEWLLARMRRCGASALVTTEKDWVRLPASLQSQVLSAAMELDFGADLKTLQDYLIAESGKPRSG